MRSGRSRGRSRSRSRSRIKLTFGAKELLRNSEKPTLGYEAGDTIKKNIKRMRKFCYMVIRMSILASEKSVPKPLLAGHMLSGEGGLLHLLLVLLLLFLLWLLLL